MATPVRAYEVDMGVVFPPRITLQFRVLRDGEVTAGVKRLRVYRDWDSVGQLAMVFETRDDEYTNAWSLDLATILAQPEWLVAGQDAAPPRRTRALYLSFTGSALLTYDITSGDGGVVGDPAELSALVRVDRIPSDRQVVVVERPADGEWRLAGYGPTPGGEGAISVRVTGGEVFALGLDDWGIEFAAGLSVSVGQRIRPTQYRGWLYEVTEAGVLPAVEPEWWAAVGDNASRPLGTGRAIAVRYFQPIGHGPLPVEVL